MVFLRVRLHGVEDIDLPDKDTGECDCVVHIKEKVTNARKYNHIDSLLCILIVDKFLGNLIALGAFDQLTPLTVKKFVDYFLIAL